MRAREAFVVGSPPMSSPALRACVLGPLLAALVQCVPTAKPEPVVPAPVALPPKLVVLVVIDQLPSWSFDVQQRALDGGIARLIREGVYFPRALYPYAATHTAPGHATIGTGVPPSVHGVVANRWLDAASGKMVEVDEDASAPVLDPRGGPPQAYGISNAHLEVDGLAETLHAARPGAQAIAIGMKGRAAGHMLGRQPDLALWFDPTVGALTSSTHFVQALPAWVTAFAA
ncbi:MAG: alkaline phosphatase family protein, partial [Deltaproteobacteria bacterium]|nr:alkaline phosphatase family protein [Nannocystaceae bacterium]